MGCGGSKPKIIEARPLILKEVSGARQVGLLGKGISSLEILDKLHHKKLTCVQGV